MSCSFQGTKRPQKYPLIPFFFTKINGHIKKFMPGTYSSQFRVQKKESEFSCHFIYVLNSSTS
nr:hypothetical protein [Methanobacterium sp. CWC-01]